MLLQNPFSGYQYIINIYIESLYITEYLIYFIFQKSLEAQITIGTLLYLNLPNSVTMVVILQLWGESSILWYPTLISNDVL